MTRSIPFYAFFLLLLLILCGAGCNKKSKPDFSAEIISVENGLLPAITVEGQPITAYSLQERMEHYNVPGVSIAVVKDGELRWAKGYGLANTETRQEVTTQTLF